MTGQYHGESEVTTDKNSKTTLVAEVSGMDLKATQIRNYIEHAWEDESSGAWYEIVLYEDGDIEVEGEDPVRLFAGSPWKEFTYLNRDSHTSEIEHGKRISRREEMLLENSEVEVMEDGSLEVETDSGYNPEDVEELPDENLIDLYKLTNLIQEGVSKEDIPQKYLDDLVTKVQRAAVSWESDSGEEPSEYR